MKIRYKVCLIVPLLANAAVAQNAVSDAAAKYVLGMTWRTDSVLVADFTCNGHKQSAIIGENASESVVAVFINGLNHKPELIHLSYPRGSISIDTENLDFDPKDLDYSLPGFQRSATCQGLLVDDHETDRFHFYRNRVARRFTFWRN